MIPVLTAAQMAALDRYAEGQLGVESRILMSSAAREVLSSISTYLPQVRKLAIFAGPGNNGGDGIALAFYARQAGLDVELYVCSESSYQPSKDGGYFLGLCSAAGLAPYELRNVHMLPESAADADLLVDALFGTGLKQGLDGFFADLIQALERMPQPVLAIDCPSGFDCTTGVPLGACVSAQLTVTFAFPKLGFFHPGASAFLGELVVRDIGLGHASPEGIAGMSVPDFILPELLLPRNPNTHKGDYGKLLIVAGHEVYPGAPRLAAIAALAMGAGLVRLVVPQSIYEVCCAHPSVMCAPHCMDGQGGFSAVPDKRLLDWLEWADALVIGPGLGDGDSTTLAGALISSSQKPTVVDADALRALPVQQNTKWPLITTPHAGELARMLDTDATEISARWFAMVQSAANQHNALVLAKANQSTLADGTLYLFPRRGHPAMATGGAGDVLSGMLGALLARIAHSVDGTMQSYSEQECRSLCASAVITAANVHAAAGFICANQLGENSVTALDVVDALPATLKSLIADARKAISGGGDA